LEIIIPDNMKSWPRWNSVSHRLRLVRPTARKSSTSTNM
jgi:hypothetical protein